MDFEMLTDIILFKPLRLTVILFVCKLKTFYYPKVCNYKQVINNIYNDIFYIKFD